VQAQATLCRLLGHIQHPVQSLHPWAAGVMPLTKCSRRAAEQHYTYWWTFGPLKLCMLLPPMLQATCWPPSQVTWCTWTLG
jgi:hypothetical protein